MRYELRYYRLGNHWTVVDTLLHKEIRSYRTRLAAQKRANILNDEATRAWLPRERRG